MSYYSELADITGSSSTFRSKFITDEIRNFKKNKKNGSDSDGNASGSNDSGSSSDEQPQKEFKWKKLPNIDFLEKEKDDYEFGG